MSHYRRADDLDDDLAYGDMPSNRWDRSRFERARHEDRERLERAPRTTQVIVEDLPRGRFEDRRYYDSPPERFASRVRREVYEDRRVEDDRALQPYRREEERDIIIDIERGQRPAPPRPGMIRRQSSLDTFDRPPPRYAREVEVFRRPASPRRRQEQEYRDVEIYREREVTRRGRAKSDLRSVVSDARSAASKHSHHSRHSHHSVHQSHHSDASSPSRASSRSRTPSPTRMPGKKGHTKLPKPQFRKAAVERFVDQSGVTFVEEDDRFVLSRALDKTMIDQILQWSREMKEPKVTTYRFEDDRLTDGPVKNDHYEAIRTEWINPPSVRGAPSVRAASPARSHRTVRGHSNPPPPPPVPTERREEVRIIREQAPPAPVIIQAPAQPQYVHAPPPPMPMTLAVTQHTERSHQDIEEEIRRLQIERDLVRIERGHTPSSQVIIGGPGPYAPFPAQDYQVVPFEPRGHRHRRSHSRGGEVIYIERERSPKREIVRIEKDKKDKKPNPKLIAGMMSILT